MKNERNIELGDGEQVWQIEQIVRSDRHISLMIDLDTYQSALPLSKRHWLHELHCIVRKPEPIFSCSPVARAVSPASIWDDEEPCFLHSAISTRWQ